MSQQSIFDIDNTIWCTWTLHARNEQSENQDYTRSISILLSFVDHRLSKRCYTLHGAALRRKDASSDSLPGGISVFEHTDHNTVYKATEKLIEQLDCRYVMFSYANGKLSEQDLRGDIWAI